MLQATKRTVSSAIGSPFLQGLFAYGASEAGAKLSRLVVVIAMARTLDPTTIGIAAGALAIGEILKSLTENGVGQRIIASTAAQLDATCIAARRIFWAWCLGLFVVQAIVAWLVWSFGDSPAAAMMIALLGVEYLFMPAGLVSCALAMREGRLKSTAAISAVQNIGANLATGLLVFFWASPFAVVLPKLLTAPVWLVGMRRLRPWTPATGVEPAPFRPFVKFGSAVLGVELLKAIRMQADKLVVGAVLGADALGIYFFAVNAGLGIATSFATAFSTVLFPYLCASNNRARSLGLAIALALALVTPVVLIQVTAASIYVELIFGEQWGPVAPLVSILCLAAFPAVIWSAASQWLRASENAGTEFLYSLGIGCMIVSATALAAPFGLTAVALSVLCASTISQLAASSGAIRAALAAFHRPNSSLSLQGA